jgi:hypothetical protein
MIFANILPHPLALNGMPLHHIKEYAGHASIVI